MVDAGKSPPLYKLANLNNKNVAGYFYREQLSKTTAPEPETYFRIESILKTKKRKGKTLYLVKFLHYPNEFNEWLPKENILDSNK